MAAVTRIKPMSSGMRNSQRESLWFNLFLEIGRGALDLRCWHTGGPVPIGIREVAAGTRCLHRRLTAPPTGMAVSESKVHAGQMRSVLLAEAWVAVELERIPGA